MSEYTASVLDKIVRNIETVVIGKRKAVALAVITLACEGHLLIEDVPGVGKTSLVSALAKSVNATFKRVSFTPDILPSDITGYSVYNRKSGEFEFRNGAVDCNFLLADEINRTTPKTQSSLLEAMQEGRVTVDGITRTIPQPFMVLATQNPIEQLGTYPLPEAQLDRFFMKISIGYPHADQEAEIILRRTKQQDADAVKAVANVDDIIQIQREIKSVHLEPSLANYIVRLSEATRKHDAVVLGASPRGSIALGRASQAFAYTSGRNFVLPEDIKNAALPVLCHRIVLKKEARIRKVSGEDVIQSVLKTTDIGI